MTCPTVRFALRGRLHNISGCPHRKGNGAAAGAERSDHQSALMRGNMTAAHVHGYCDRQCPSLLRRTSWRRSSSRRGRVRPDPQAMETHLASIEFTIEGVVHPFLITSDNDVDHWAQACSAAQTRPPFNNPVELSRIGTSALKPHTSSPLGTSRRAIPRGGSQQQSASARDAAQARPVDSTASARMCNSGAHFRVPICRFGDSSHSVGTSCCNGASVEQTSCFYSA